MVSEDDILLKQFDELYNLRERSIKSIASSYNAYTTFLTILVGSIGLFIKINEGEINDSWWIVLFLTGIAVFAYGWYIHHLLISSHITLSIYTKKINLTRGYLISKMDMKNHILLPYTQGKPKFNKQGFLEEDFSKMGVVAFIRWTNSLILCFTTFSLILKMFPFIFNWQINRIDLYILLAIDWGIALLCFSCGIHKIHHKNMIKEARKKWKKEKEKNKYSILDKKSF